MGRGVAVFFTADVVIEQFLGTDSAGTDLYAAPITVKGFQESQRALVRDANGEQVVSSGRIFTYISAQASANPNARITCQGVVSKVMVSNPFDGPGLRLPTHLVITLQ